MRSLIKQLKAKKARTESGLFVVEGEKLVLEIPPGWNIRGYTASESFASSNDISGLLTRASCEVVRDSVFESLSSTVSPQGILAVCEQINRSLADVLDIADSDTRPFFLMGECLNDPGNIGALIRSAAAAGASGVILTDGSGDIYNPKVLRAAAGAALRIPIAEGVSLHEAFSAMAQLGLPVYAAHPRGGSIPYSLDLSSGFCLLVGSESHGISEEAASKASALIRLPMADDVESLNASVAGSVLLYEAVRQRQL